MHISFCCCHSLINCCVSISQYHQSSLPKFNGGAHGAPLAFILYADKTRISTAGSVKAYPVIARIANLPVDIRNGKSIGGGCLVGWLPIVCAFSYSNLCVHRLVLITGARRLGRGRKVDVRQPEARCLALVVRKDSRIYRDAFEDRLCTQVF